MLRTRFAPRNDADYWLDRRMTYVHMRHPLDPQLGRSTELLYHRWMLGWTRQAMPGDQSRVLAMHVTARPEAGQLQARSFFFHATVARRCACCGAAYSVSHRF